MRERVYVKGKSSSEKFESVERALQRFGRRLHKKIGVSIPPIPVSAYVETPEEGGILLRYMLPPAKVVVDSAAIFVGGFPEKMKRITLVADIWSSDEGSQKKFDIKDIVNVFSIGMESEPGSRFELRLDDPSIEISKIWMSFLLSVEPSKAQLHEMLVDKLEEV